uniref:X8 domain-containing protein n=1 Tax=Chenopodium quinoa TaxID=63459 RepID=A0A803NBB0_CHEQI
MKNIHSALVKYGLDSKIKVSSPIALSALGNSYPFSRVVPARIGNSDVISLDYALFRENPGVVDAGNGFRYFNLFDAQIDAVFAAMSALKYDDIPIVVTETGWPSKGDPMEIGASVENAAAYNGNLVRRILTGGGTPLRPKAELTKVYNIPLTLEEVKSWKDVKGSSPAPAVGTPAVSPATGNGGGTGRVTVKETWCVANGEMSEAKLQAALDYACGEGQADCHPIQPGSPCFDPNTLEAHASYAFNSFWFL